AMRVPIICMDQRLRQFAASFSSCFSKPQRRYFEIVLLALLLCQETRTLSGLLRQVLARATLSGLSRFLAIAPWSSAEVATTWRTRFDTQVAPLVAANHTAHLAARPIRPGRPAAPVVTGYFIGDDSTMEKVRGKKMAGLGKHHSTTAGTRVVGHSLVQGLYVVAGRPCPLEPLLYRQQAVCRKEDVPFRSKIELMEAQIESFKPLVGTRTHVLVDSWYAAKRIWKAARGRGFEISSGLKSNRMLRIADEEAPKGWRWQSLPDYAASLTEADYQQVRWPSQGEEQRQVWVHVVQTRVKQLYRCQVLLVRESLEAPLKQVRYFASSDLEGDAATLVGHLAARWAVEVLFEDGKELLGVDQYQVMRAEAVVRFWTLAWAAYAFLDEERARLRVAWGRHVTMGEARREVQRAHWRHLMRWMHQQFVSGTTPETLFDQLAA
ncbi:MAG: transposase, partial [Chloroflexi bacterium]|nr:transposase [Chloroflexota bacterium]